MFANVSAFEQNTTLPPFSFLKQFNETLNYSISRFIDPPPPPDGGLGGGFSPFFNRRIYYIIPPSLFNWSLQSLNVSTRLFKNWLLVEEDDSSLPLELKNKNPVPLSSKDSPTFNSLIIEPLVTQIYSLTELLFHPYTRAALLTATAITGGLATSADEGDNRLVITSATLAACSALTTLTEMIRGCLKNVQVRDAETINGWANLMKKALLNLIDPDAQDFSDGEQVRQFDLFEQTVDTIYATFDFSSGNLHSSTIISLTRASVAAFMNSILQTRDQDPNIDESFARLVKITAELQKILLEAKLPEGIAQRVIEGELDLAQENFESPIDSIRSFIDEVQNYATPFLTDSGERTVLFEQLSQVVTSIQELAFPSSIDGQSVRARALQYVIVLLEGFSNALQTSEEDISPDIIKQMFQEIITELDGSFVTFGDVINKLINAEKPGGEEVLAPFELPSRELRQGMLTDRTEQTEGATDLIDAIFNGPSAIPTLLGAGVDVNAADSEGRTPLMYAIRHNPSIVSALIRAGANAVAESAGCVTPLLVAVESHPSVIPDLVQAGANVNAATSNHVSPILVAVQCNPSAIPTLVEAGVDVNAADSEGRIPMVFAIRHNPAAISALVEAGANVNAVSDNFETPLLVAVESHPSVIPDLVQVGADVNAVILNGLTPILFAISHNPSAIPTLVEAGADVNVANSEGRTPMMFAIQHSPSAIPTLVQSGVDVNAADSEGRTPMMFAIQHNPSAISTLVEAGVDINAADSEGRTPMMFAIQHNPSAISTLVQAGANVNAVDKDGLTPILFAARNKFSAIPDLARAGANILAVDKEGLTAADFLEKYVPNSDSHPAETRLPIDQLSMLANSPDSSTEERERRGQRVTVV